MSGSNLSGNTTTGYFNTTLPKTKKQRIADLEKRVAELERKLAWPWWGITTPPYRPPSYTWVGTDTTAYGTKTQSAGSH